MTSFYAHSSPKKLKGYRIWACDTTVQLLPDSEDARKMGVHKNQYKTVASLKISTYFDIYSKLFTSVKLFAKKTADLLCCLDEQVQNVPKDVIAVYDRGYSSQIIPFFHHRHGSKYVIRLRNDYSKEVINFIQSSDNEQYITIPISEKTYKRLENYGIRQSQHDTISLRLVKVLLSTGEIEILVSNLDKSFTINDLAEIYNLRWGVETAYNSIKNQLMLGTFSGYSQRVIEQDIWCNFIFYNLQSITILETEAKLKAINKRRQAKPSKRQKQPNAGYQINRNIGANTLRMYINRLLFCDTKNIQKWLTEMSIYYLQSIEPVKPSHKERQRKRTRINDRHHTEWNYKRGF